MFGKFKLIINRAEKKKKKRILENIDFGQIRLQYFVNIQSFVPVGNALMISVAVDFDLAMINENRNFNRAIVLQSIAKGSSHKHLTFLSERTLIRRLKL